MNDIKILIDEQSIYKKIDEMALQIQNDYKNEEIIFLCVLKGSFPFTWELGKRIKNNNISFKFIELSSYGDLFESSGNIQIKNDISDDITNKNILILEDIIDTGNTLSFLINYLKSKNAKSVKIATLLNKPSRRIIDIPVDYVGFTIEDKFVLGFGLDLEQKYRNLPYIGYIEN